MADYAVPAADSERQGLSCVDPTDGGNGTPSAAADPSTATASLAPLPGHIDRMLRLTFASMPECESAMLSLQMLGVVQLIGQPQYSVQCAQLIPQLIVDAFCDNKEVDVITSRVVVRLPLAATITALLPIIKAGAHPAPYGAIRMLDAALDAHEYAIDDEQLFACKLVLQQRTGGEQNDPIVRSAAKSSIRKLHLRLGTFAVAMRVLRVGRQSGALATCERCLDVMAVRLERRTRQTETLYEIVQQIRGTVPPHEKSMMMVRAIMVSCFFLVGFGPELIVFVSVFCCSAGLRVAADTSLKSSRPAGETMCDAFRKWSHENIYQYAFVPRNTLHPMLMSYDMVPISSV